MIMLFFYNFKNYLGVRRGLKLYNHLGDGIRHLHCLYVIQLKQEPWQVSILKMQLLLFMSSPKEVLG